MECSTGSSWLRSIDRRWCKLVGSIIRCNRTYAYSGRPATNANRDHSSKSKRCVYRCIECTRIATGITRWRIHPQQLYTKWRWDKIKNLKGRVTNKKTKKRVVVLLLWRDKSV